jgi:SAM-dependent methyltransferase
MAKLNFDYYELVNDLDSQNKNMDNEMLQYAKNQDNGWYEDGRWPIVHQMSPLRHNILNWYPFKENCTIMEICGGHGALTGLLCERASRVISVEPVKSRAEVNYARHSDCDNLEIVVADFQSIPDNWKFDYVIVNGVLEYSSYMVNSENPYQDFLRLAANHLNKEGRILLAIENRLGIKYFSGSKEYHTEKFFSGVNGYPNNENVRTFSKQELSDLICSANLNIVKFYYPYPDYRFPSEIFTDKSINKMKPSVANYPMDMNRVKLFDDEHVYRSLMKLNIMQNFANSFLIEIAIENNLTPFDAGYIKVSANRNEKYKIMTIIDEKRHRVYKKSISPKGEKHLQKMKKFDGFRLGNLKNIECLQERDGISYDFLPLQSLEQKLLEQCRTNNLDGFIDIFKALLFAIPYSIQLSIQPISKDFEEAFGLSKCERRLRWINNLNIDLISSNIFPDGDIYHVIDYEWHMPCQIPLEFVVWRLLNQFIEDNDLSHFIKKELLYSLVNIDEDVEKCFKEWELHFAYKFVGIKNLYDISKKIISIDLDEVMQTQLKARFLESSLFFDVGEGFSEDLYAKSIAEDDSSGFIVYYNFEGIENIRKLRWDPLEGYASCVFISEIDTDAVIESVVPLNAERITEDAGYEFFSYDPQFEIVGNFSKATFIRIKFSCKIMDWTLGYHKREQELISVRQENESNIYRNEMLEEQKKQLNDKNSLLMNEIEETRMNLIKTTQLCETLNSNLVKKSDELKCVSEELKCLYEEKDNLLNSIDKLRSQLEKRNNFTEQHRVKAALNVMRYGKVYKEELNE